MFVVRLEGTDLDDNHRDMYLNRTTLPGGTLAYSFTDSVDAQKIIFTTRKECDQAYQNILNSDLMEKVQKDFKSYKIERVLLEENVEAYYENSEA